MNNFLAKFGAVASLSVLAACATGNEADIDTDASVTGDEALESSIVPGSQEALNEIGSVAYFGFDRFDLTPTARDTLRRQAAFLNEFPGASIRIEGHCDERGTEEYNLALGARRANSTKDFLVGLGVDPARITTISYGKDRPVSPASTEQAWALNRRTETKITSVM